MYTHIVDPITNESRSLFSNKGQDVLKKYLRLQGDAKLIIHIKVILFSRSRKQELELSHSPIFISIDKTETMRELSRLIYLRIKKTFRKLVPKQYIINDKRHVLTSSFLKDLNSIPIYKYYNTDNIHKLGVIVVRKRSENVSNNIITSYCSLKEKKHLPYDIVVYSADYDGCWDILFAPVRRLLIKNNNNRSNKYSYIRNKLVNNIKFFFNKSRKHILMVGSARQSIEMDQYNRNIHKSQHKKMGIRYKKNEGYCLRDFNNISSLNKWTLLRFLYPDISKSTYSKVAENMARDIEAQKGGDMTNKNIVWTNPSICPGKKLIKKSEIIFSQINILNILYPKKKILYLFYDDDSSGNIFNEITTKLKKKKIPSNITIKLYRFNWFNILNKSDELTEIKYTILKNPILNKFI